jgi:hypothetical protein
MLDPATAFQTGAAVISLVDFGSRVLSDSFEIYRSGQAQTARNESLVDISQQLLVLSEEVQSQTANTQCGPDAILIRIAQRCKNVSQRLQSAITDLRTQKRSRNKVTDAARSFVAALAGVLKQKDIDEMKTELSEIRSQMILAILVSIS